MCACFFPLCTGGCIMTRLVWGGVDNLLACNTTVSAAACQYYILCAGDLCCCTHYLAVVVLPSVRWLVLFEW